MHEETEMVFERFKKFEKFEAEVPFFVKSKAERVVCGAIYIPDSEPDTQGDTISSQELQSAVFAWMESEEQIIKINHKERATGCKLLEIFIAPSDLDINGHPVKMGSAIMTVRLDEKTFKRVKSGELNGFSFAGTCLSE